MSLHDRDYVREKDFNYKKMEYQKNTSRDPNLDYGKFTMNFDDSIGSSSKSKMPFYFFTIMFFIGVLIYFKN